MQNAQVRLYVLMYILDPIFVSNKFNGSLGSREVNVYLTICNPTVVELEGLQVYTNEVTQNLSVI